MKVNTMLKVTSILYIIFAAIEAVVIILAVAGGALLGSIVGHAATGTIVLGIMMIPSAISVVLEMMAGINGVRGEHLFSCIGLGGTILALGIISLILSMINGSSVIGALLNIALSILYLIGASNQRDNA